MEFPRRDRSSRRRHGLEDPAPRPTRDPVPGPAGREPARGAEPAPRGAEPIRTEPAPAAVHLTAQEQHLKHIESAVAKTYNVPPEEMRGWWRRKMYFVTSSVSMAALGTATAFGAKSALAGTAVHTALAGVLGTTFGPAALGAAAAIPVVMAVRWGLGMYNEDRRVRAGRDSEKMKKRARKLHKDAASLGATLNVDPAAVESHAKELSRRVSWGTVAANIGVGAFTGALTAEALAGGAKPVTNFSGRAFGSVWERVSSGDWWYQKASGIWNALWGTAPTEATPAARAPAELHGAACDGAFEQIRALETELNAARAQISALNGNIDDLEQSLTRLQDEHSISESARQVFEDKFNALRTENSLLRDQIANSAITEQELTQRITELNARAASLRSEIERLAAENASLRDPVPRRVLPGEPIRPRVIPMPDAVPFPNEGGSLLRWPEPLEIEITGPDSAIARHGLDGLLRETILAGSRAPEIVNNQFIEAVRAVMVANPEFAQALQETTRDVVRNGDIVFQNRGTLNMRVFGDSRFLDLLQTELETMNQRRGHLVPKYSELVPFLRSWGGIDAFLDNMAQTYNRRY